MLFFSFRFWSCVISISHITHTGMTRSRHRCSIAQKSVPNLSGGGGEVTNRKKCKYFNCVGGRDVLRNWTLCLEMNSLQYVGLSPLNSPAHTHTQKGFLTYYELFRLQTRFYFASSPFLSHRGGLCKFHGHVSMYISAGSALQTLGEVKG